MVTTSYSDQQGSKSRQKVMRLYKQWHRPISKRFIKPPYSIYREQPRSTGLLSPTHDQRSQQQTGHQPVLINKSKFLKATHRTKIRKSEIPRSLELVKPAREPASSRSKPCAFLKAPRILPVRRSLWPLQEEKGQWSDISFPSETSLFAPLILAHRGSAFPWLVNDRAALRLRRIWYVPTR